MSSWWVEDFQGRLVQEQARMKRELEPRSLKRVFEKLQKLEQQELYGLATDRNPVAPLPELRVIVDVEESDVIDAEEENRS